MSDTSREVLEQVELFAQAFLIADVETLDSLLADSYIHVNGSSGSLLNKQEWLRFMSTRRAELDSGQLAIEHYLNSEIDVAVYGEAAVVMGINRTEGIRNGARFSLKLRFTNVWVKENGLWRRAAFHDSPVSAV